MRNYNILIKIFFCSIWLILLELCGFSSIYAAPSNPSLNKEFNLLHYISNPIKIDDNLTLPVDRPLGNLNAPVTIIEYASFSCPHCWLFNSTIFPEIQKKYIDTGKVLFIMRDFPLDGAALKASTLVECYFQEKYSKVSTTETKRNYLHLYKPFFQALNKPTASPNLISELKEIALNQGMDGNEFDKCLHDKAISEQIMKVSHFVMNKLNINGAPTFYINGKQYKGYINKELFINEIEKALKE